jgi:hypothetical protein
LGASSFDFGWAHFGLDEANDCSAGATLRFFVISPFMGDFAYRLNVAAVDHAGSRACVRESTQVMMLSKKQWFQPRRMGSFWSGGVLVFVCVELAACCC